MKNSFISQGKNYISAKRASEISDYSSDYIGQLCRAEKLDCTMIGRSWFVTEESLNDHKANVLQNEIYRNRVENLKGAKKSTGNIVDDLIAGNTVAAPEKTPEREFVYTADERPLMPVLSKEKISVDTFVVASTVETSKPEISSTTTEPIISSHVLVSKPSAAAIDSALDISYADVEAPITIRKVSNDSASYESVRSPYGRSVSLQRVSSEQYLGYESHRPSISRRIAKTVAVVVIVFGFVTGASFVFRNSPNMPMATSLSGSVSGIAQSVGLFFKNGFEGVLAFFGGGRKTTDLAVNVPEVVTLHPTQSSPQGIAIVSSTGSDSADQALKEQIKSNFSDEVEVKPDQSGTAGVVTPVFRKTKGSDFVYVLVPVDEKSPP